VTDLARFRVAPMAFLVAVGFVAVGIALAATSLADPNGYERTLFYSPGIGVAWAGIAGLFCFGYVGRVLLVGEAQGATPKCALGAALGLLFLGFAALQLSRILQARGWPIVATQTVPPASYAARAFWIGLGGWCLLALGVVLGRLIGQRYERLARPATQTQWSALVPVAALLALLGFIGITLVVWSTGKIALFSRNVDSVRFTQSRGIAYAGLLEYELLASACLCGAILVLGGKRRIAPVLLFAVSISALAIFRADRTPIVFIALTLGFVRTLGGRRLNRATAALVVALVVVLVSGLGVFRLQSSVGTVDRREAVVRSLFDVAPEFREQAFVYHVFPSQAPYLGGRDAGEILSSVFPSRALSVAGIDKAAVYGDNSHDYTAVMDSLGYYTIQKPLRTGLIGELWMGFGPWGIVFGLLIAGVVITRIGVGQPGSPLSLVRRSMLSSLVIFALITPLAALLPLALMLLAPVTVIEALLRSAPSLSGHGVADALDYEGTRA
jgi:hypothetical protein